MGIMEEWEREEEGGDYRNKVLICKFLKKLKVILKLLALT